MKTLLVVHQGAELYGSDRALLTALSGLDSARFRVVVAVPESGPLVRQLEQVGARVHVLPLVRVDRASLRPTQLVRLALRSRLADQALARAVRGESVDLVYSNTLAVLSGALFASRRGLPHLWHVHEIVRRPLLARRAFAQLLLRSQRVVFNSEASRRCFADVAPALGGADVILNGLDRPDPVPGARDAVRGELGIGPHVPLLALVGRLSRWKGQRLLVDAVERLEVPLHTVFVGSAAPGQEVHERRLRERIAASSNPEAFTVLPFRDPWPIYDACDVVAVPSTEPEPFGLVALEGMLAGRPVVASRQGGLPELVEDGVSGRLVQPGSARALSEAIAELASDATLRRAMGVRGREIAVSRFATGRYVREISAVLEAMDSS